MTLDLNLPRFDIVRIISDADQRRLKQAQMGPISVTHTHTTPPAPPAPPPESPAPAGV
jgi:hypothetical protein